MVSTTVYDALLGLDSAFGCGRSIKQGWIDLTYRDIDGMTPTHFFGELTKTQEGCMYLRERGLVAEFAEIVRLHGLESEDQAVLTNVKSMLWVLVSRSCFCCGVNLWISPTLWTCRRGSGIGSGGAGCARLTFAGPYWVDKGRPAILGERRDHRGDCGDCRAVAYIDYERVCPSSSLCLVTLKACTHIS